MTSRKRARRYERTSGAHGGPRASGLGEGIMASLTDRSDSECYYGSSPDEIAEAVWGRGAHVRRMETIGEGAYLGEVWCTNSRSHVQTVLARVVIRPEDERGRP